MEDEKLGRGIEELCREVKPVFGRVDAVTRVRRNLEKLLDRKTHNGTS